VEGRDVQKLSTLTEATSPKERNMFRIRFLLSAVGSLALALGLAHPAAGQSDTFQSQHHAYRVEPVVEGLENPWSIAFLPNGDMLVTERPGRLRIVRNGVLDAAPIAGVPEVRAQSQGGLLDVALHPDFATNRLVYLTYSKPNADGSEGTTALIRGRLEEGRLADVEELLETRAWSRSGGHYGSRLVFDGDGYLFMTIGDRQAPSTGDLEAHPAQDLMNHQGAILRLHDDGRVPADNPFVGRTDALPEIWSYGHRSPQGFIRHPETGDLWMTEHGPQGGDELNLVQRGANYGWPVIGYGVNYRSGTAIHEGILREGMESPVRFWVPSIATSGLLLYTGDRFPEWRGNLLAGGLTGQRIARLTLDGQRVTSEETLAQGIGRVRDLEQGPDGLIYIAIDASSGATILRLAPATLGGR
jgi:glucose/arabinose dehydrogenase